MQLLIDLGSAPLWQRSRALGMAVRFMLQATTEINLKVLQINRVVHRTSGGRIPLIPSLYRSGVVYKEEPTNWALEHFDTIPAALKRKWVDCDDAAPWRAAELRFTGEDPRANIMVKWKPLPDGKKLYHVVVRRSNIRRADGFQFFKDARGFYEDPCKVLGMGRAAAKHAGL